MIAYKPPVDRWLKIPKTPSSHVRLVLFALTLAAVSLQGCFWSSVPLIAPKNAAFPLPANVILEQFDVSEKGEEKPTNAYSVSIKDDFYVLMADGKVEFKVRLARIRDSDQYIAMLKSDGRDTKEYVYGLLEIRDDGFHFFMFAGDDLEEFRTNNLVIAPLQVADGYVEVNSFSSLVDLLPRMAVAGAFSRELIYRVADGKHTSPGSATGSGGVAMPPPSNSGDWRLTENTDPLTDATIPIARLRASRVEGAPQGVLLQLECQGREAVVYLDWMGVPLRTLFKPGGVAITEIAVRFDSAQANRLVWSIVSEGQVRNPPPESGSVLQAGLNLDAIMIPSRRGLNAMWVVGDFARHLASSARVVVQAHSSRNQTMTAFFDTTGAEAAVNHLRRACP